jgi:beta-fructofuranosidase
MSDTAKKTSVMKKRGAKADSAVNPAISRAMFHIKAAMPRAESDPYRPLYHFCAPSQWMGEPSGTIYHEGWHHLFYQFNPYSDARGPMHWGHARSRDLVRWEHMPIALYPSANTGEEHCFSGCSAINGDGNPTLFYTSIRKGAALSDYAEQWVAMGDKQFMVWKKIPAPVLIPSANTNLVVKDWRHPFVFFDSNRVFMVTGGKLEEKDGGDAVVLLYEAENANLTFWTYRGVLFRHPNKDLRSIEYPNFFKLGDKYVLLVSPHGPVEYYTGAFDIGGLTFTPEKQGLVDQSDNYYATNVLFDGNGRCILLGGIKGFKSDRGWNGCIGLPRVLSLDSAGSLLQELAPEIRKSRTNYIRIPAFTLNRGSQLLQDIEGDSLEIAADLKPEDAKAFGIRLRCSADGQKAFVVRYNNGILDVGGTEAPAKLDRNGTLSLKVFMDRSVIEVYAGQRACVTKVLYPDVHDTGVEVFAEDSELNVLCIDAWTVRRPA